eukprot:4535276-Pyramimonas_sp.AAC.1
MPRLVPIPAHTPTYSYADLHILRPSHSLSGSTHGLGPTQIHTQTRKGAARGVSTGPFAASLWGCLRRLARFHAQHPLLSEQI